MPETSAPPRESKSTKGVLIAGGGLAGLAAATVLAERGVRVVLVEKEAYLGGRAGSWEDRLADGTRFHMERGFHAFFRQYYALRMLLQRIDPGLTKLAPLRDYPLLGPDQRSESFADLPKRVPFNLIRLVQRTPSLRLRDLFRVNVRAALEMLSYDPHRTYARWDHRTAREYLDALRFPPRARQMLFEVFAHSFFNPEDDYSAAELLAMFHFYFLGNPEGLIFDVMRQPFGKAIFEPLARYLEVRGVAIRTNTRVQSVRREGSLFVTTLEGGREVRTEACVLALDVPALQQVLDASPELDDATFREQVRSLRVTLPFAVLRLWMERPPRADRAPFAGTAGVGILDNISIYEKLEDESREWARRTGGSVIELHAYAVPEHYDEAQLRKELLEGLHAIYPETREVRVIEDRFLLRRDCPAFGPGSAELRPTVATAIDDLYLAGDFVRMQEPSALMERAVASGFTAANAILARKGLAEEPFASIAPRGILARA